MSATEGPFNLLKSKLSERVWFAATLENAVKLYMRSGLVRLEETDHVVEFVRWCHTELGLKYPVD